MENPIDWFALGYTGQVAFASSRSRRYEIINDNADPRAINPAGFQFAMLDHDAEQVVNPLRQLLGARADVCPSYPVFRAVMLADKVFRARGPGHRGALAAGQGNA